tara:strand:+ start:1815 stop:3377 length:1563 start_codon:yes stop_codon:yes gene_type:complete
MPRFENLKGSMNPFSNNRPRLTASERIRNKRDATIYQAEKSKYQASRKCYNGGKNIKYYKNGTVRSTINHEMNQKLARGAVLCEDCNHQGLVCASTLKKNNFAKVNLGNSAISTFNLGTGLDIASNQINTTTVIISDISGSWNPSSNSFKGDISLCGPSGNLVCPYGYIDNLIKVPRNLDGSGIVIDPSNLLFNQDDNCNTFKIPKPNYLKYIGINTYLVYEGILADGKAPAPPLYLFNSSTRYEGPTNLNIYSVDGSNKYTDLLNQFVVISFGTTPFGGAIWPITGYIRKICVTNKKITVANAGWNQDSIPFPPYWHSVINPASYAGAPKYFEADVFKMFIEIHYLDPDALLWQGTISRSNCIDQTIPYPSDTGPLWTNDKEFWPQYVAGAGIGNVPDCARPQFKPSFSNPGFIIKRQAEAGGIGSIIAISSWAGDAVLGKMDISGAGTVEAWYSYQNNENTIYSGSGYNASPMTVGLGQFKLSSGCSEPQVRQNKTRQSYLSCIEQGTKNIKFTKNTL